MTAAIEAAEAGQLFRFLENFRALGLAVSGGPDSIALMALMARWAGERADRPRLLVLTVDHRLRPEAAAEAEMVAAAAASLGLAHRTLLRPGAAPAANIQAEARAARYRLFAAAAAAENLDAVVTAHHLDDQAETLLLRLGRGSGLYGLAAMTPDATVEGVRVLRPLLGVARARLAATAEAAGLPVVADPSNDDARYARVRLRRLMPALAREGLTGERLAATAGRLRRAAAALDEIAESLLVRSGAFHPAGFAILDAAPLVAAPEEIGLRALSRLVREVAMAPYPPRLERLEAVYAAIRAAARDAGELRRTLAGAVVSFAGGRLLVYPEAGRAGLPAFRLEPGQTRIWHRRFEVALAEDAAPVEIAALGAEGWRALPDTLRAGLIRAAAITTLAARRDGELVAVPSLALPQAPTGLLARHLGSLFADASMRP